MTDETMGFFRDDTPPDVRRQVLHALATAAMSDLERAKFYGLPDGCRMREGAKILSPENLIIGTNVWIGENAVLDASGGLEIGSNTSIGLSVYLWTHDSHQLNLSGNNIREAKDQIRRRPVRIGSNCFIAGPSVLMPGTTIGDSCVIAPLSLVKSNLSDGTIYTPYRDFLKMDRRITAFEARLAELESNA
jgi:acetyltransferase-like isoleucine patch superfamily enzyme